MLIPRVVLLVFGLSASVVMAAERRETLDLAGNVSERSVPADVPFRIVIDNRLPKFKYDIKTRIRNLETKPLDVPSDLTRSANNLCDALPKLFLDTLDALDQEERIGQEIETFRARAATGDCSVEQKGRLELVIASLSETKDQVFVLNPGQELVVNVERQNPDRSWEYVLSTGARGQWRAFYGFNFIPNNDDLFFTAQGTDDPTTFVVTKKADRQDWDFAPSVFFTWRSAKQAGQDWGHGPTAGLGFDTSNPIVFGGWALTYNENIALTAGVVFHKQKRLDGRYEEGQVVNENFGTDQLETETYEPNLYIGIAFRFGSSPFSNDSE